MDIARKESEELIIIELGDGQVSGLQKLDPEEFSAALEQVINSDISQLKISKIHFLTRII